MKPTITVLHRDGHVMHVNDYGICHGMCDSGKWIIVRITFGYSPTPWDEV